MPGEPNTEDLRVEDQKRRDNGARIIKWEEDVPLPEIPNVNYGVLMLQLMKQHGDKIALVDSATEKSYTYKHVHDMVMIMCNDMAAAGVGFGDSVVIVSYNHVDMPSAILSIMLLGATCALANPALTSDELAHVVRVSEAKWAVVHERAVEKATSAFSSLGSESLRQLWILGGSSGTSFGDLSKSLPLNLPLKRDDYDSAKTVALMPFSSGTTGLPKGVMLSHRNLITTCVQNKFIRSLNPHITFNLHESTLLILPMYHMYGYNMTMNTFMAGGKLVLLTKFSPKNYFQAIQKYKVTFSPVVPYIMRFLVETPLIEKYDLSSLYGFSTGSAPIAEKTLDALSQKSGKISMQGYAMTESSGIGSTNRGLPGSKKNSVGRMGPFFQAKVIDVETGQMLGEKEEGELCLRGPSIMLGYANNPKATAETIDSEGWLHTGDIAYYDDENEIYITDRIKDLIKVKGHQVSPAELEILIQKFENVSEVAVVGVPNERLGEVPRAFIVPVPGTTIDKMAVIKHVEENVVSYKKLVGGVEVTNELPKNHIGKILRRELRKAYVTTSSKL